MLGIPSLVSSFGIGAVFLWSAVPKMRHPRGFAVTVLTYEVLPATLSLMVARFLPVLELLIGLLLITGTLTRVAGMATSLLLCGFLAAVSVNVVRGRKIDCGCFGRERSIGPKLLVQDGALLLIAVVVSSSSSGWVALAPWSPFSLVRLTVLDAVGVCIVVTAVAASLLEIVARKDIPTAGKRSVAVDVRG